MLRGLFGGTGWLKGGWLEGCLVLAGAVWRWALKVPLGFGDQNQANLNIDCNKKLKVSGQASKSGF